MLLCRERLVHHDLEHKLVEPLVTHHIMAFHATVFTPRVLHLEPDGATSLLIHMYAGDDHRMCHGRLVGIQSLGLGKSQRDIECLL